MSNAIALVSTNVPAHVLQGTGLGNENVGQNVTIPRVKLLQKMSDEVDKYNSKYIQGAEPGHFLNSLTGQNYGEELYVISLLLRTSSSYGVTVIRAAVSSDLSPHKAPLQKQSRPKTSRRITRLRTRIRMSCWSRIRKPVNLIVPP